MLCSAETKKKHNVIESGDGSLIISEHCERARNLIKIFWKQSFFEGKMRVIGFWQEKAKKKVNDIECVKRKIRKIYNVPHRLP
jgi:hypothetical protein